MKRNKKAIISVIMALAMVLSGFTAVQAAPDQEAGPQAPPVAAEAGDAGDAGDTPTPVSTLPEQSEDMRNLRENTLVGLPHRSDRAPDFFVSPDGDDNNAGTTRETAFATLDRARLAVRAILPTATEDIVVELAGGLYPMTEVTFDYGDSGRPGVTVFYQAAEGERPILSAGFTMDPDIWERVPPEEVPQAGDLPVYRTTLERDSKLRHMYVNEQRANMTLSPVIGAGLRTMTGTPTVNIRTRFHEDPDHPDANPQPWAWHARNGIPAGIIFHENVGITPDTRNPENIESSRVAGAARWARPFITFESIEYVTCTDKFPNVPAGFRGGVLMRYQMPYGAIAHSLSDNTNFTGGNDQVIRNAWEFFNRRGDFYFDQANENLYYIPRIGEDINSAEVVIPYKSTVIDIRGIPFGDRTDPNPDPIHDLTRVRYLTFSGLTLAHTDYILEQLEGTYIDSIYGMRTTHSTGFASIQGCIVATAFLWSSTHGGGSNATGMNWHNAMYRHYDLPPAALQINAARSIRFLNGEVILTGFNGIHIENDVRDIEITGNLIRDTLAGAIAVGHPTHIYENDEAGLHESPLMTFTNGFTFSDAPWDNLPAGGTPAYHIAGIEKEKFRDGTEAVPQDIYITNNVIWRVGAGFPGVNTLTSFYTTNLQILHNLMYDATYGHVSLGWGWCEFDGYGWNADRTPKPGAPAGNEAANKLGGPYHGTHEASFARIPVYTTTSRANRVNHNIIENCMRLLADSGAIYTLGRQGDPGNLPDGGSWHTLQSSPRALTSSPVTDPTHNWHHSNWRNYTTMNYNFLNPIADDSELYEAAWANAIHPDEGSTFIKMVGNVMRSRNTTNRRFIELNNWKRKSDMWAVNNFTTESNLMNGAPRITFLQPHANNRIIPWAEWPLEAHDIILGAGPEDQFLHNVPDDIRPATELELRGYVRTRANQPMNLGGHLSAEDTVWLAPAGTAVEDLDASLPNMTSAPGDAGAIMIPYESGVFKLFIVFEDGTVMESKYHVESTTVRTNIRPGVDYRVSQLNPLVIELNLEEYTFTLNGGPVSHGFRISHAAEWMLVATSIADGTRTEIDFTTYVLDADRILPQYVTVEAGQPIRFAVDLNFPEAVYPEIDIWVVHGSNLYPDPTGAVGSRASGTDLQIIAPTVPGPGYVIVIFPAGYTEPILSQSHAQITVVEPQPPAVWPDGVGQPDTWFSSLEGITLNAAGQVTRWESIGTVADRAATPGAHNNNPPRMKNMPGWSAQSVEFNGGHLIFTHPLNTPDRANLRYISILALSAHTGMYSDGNADAVVFWNESGSWGQTALSPRRMNIQTKFGTGQTGDTPIWSRPANTHLTSTCFTVSAVTRRGGTGGDTVTNAIERIYVDGENVRQITGRRNALLNNRPLASMGRAVNMGAPGPGPWQTGADKPNTARFDLAELMIFDRTLTTEEVEALSLYVKRRHSAAIAGCPLALIEYMIGRAEARIEFDYEEDSWAVFAEALADALEVVEDPDATQEEIDGAYFVLRDAYLDLVRAPWYRFIARYLLPDNVTVNPGQLVSLSFDLNESEMDIWLAPAGTVVGDLDESLPYMTRVDGNRISIIAPEDYGQYQLILVSDGEIISRSIAVVSVVEVLTTPTIPMEGLDIWLDATRGVTTDGAGNVIGWENQATAGPRPGVVFGISDRTAAPLPPGMSQRWGTPAPALGLPEIDGYPTAGTAEAGYAFVNFGPSARPLGVDDFHNYDGSREMTIFTLANPTNPREPSADQNGVIFFGDINWSGINLGLGTGGVNVRFGNGVAGNGGNMTATTTISGLTAVTARMDEGARIIRVNGTQVGQNTQTGANIPINNTRPIVQIGYALGGWYTSGAARPFRGEIAQILLYNRALSNEEVEQVEAFLDYMAVGGTLPGPVVCRDLLGARIEYAESLDADNFTGTSWAALLYALNAAREVYADEDADQVDVNGAFYDLRDAIEDLVERADRDELRARKVEAGELLGGHFTPVTLAALRAAYNAAWAVYNDTDADQVMVDQAYANLTQAMNGLVELPSTITVTFNPAGGSVPQSYRVVPVGGTFGGAFPTPTRDGHVFRGWFTDTVAGVRIMGTHFVTQIEDLVLYARWERSQEILIHFWGEGGTVFEPVRQVTAGADNFGGAFLMPVREGFIFEGWFTCRVAGTRIMGTHRVNLTEDTNLFARWRPDNSIQLTLNPTGGTVSPTTRTVVLGGTYGGAFPRPQRLGYEFTGWFTNYGRRVMGTHTATHTANFTLYAGWERTGTIIVTFNPTGGNVSPTSRIVSMGDTHGGAFPFPTHPNPNTIFNGWFTAEVGGVRIVGTQVVTHTENFTLFARWTTPAMAVKGDLIQSP